MPQTQPADSPAQEVRVSAYAQRALSRWYVIVLAIIVAIGLVVLKGSAQAKGKTEASATVYMGQPVTPGGGAIFAAPPYANLSAVSTLITSAQSRAAAAAAAGVTPDSLDGNITAHQLASASSSSTATKATSGPAYYSIVAEGKWKARQAATIANTLAGIVAHKANGYVDAKITGLRANVLNEHQTITRLSNTIKVKQGLALSLAKDASTDASKAALVAALLSEVTSDTAIISNAQAALSQNQTSLASAVNIEAASIANPAAGHAVSAQHRRSSLIVAAFAGLIIGVLLALAWDAVRRRQTSTAPAEEAAS